MGNGKDAPAPVIFCAWATPIANINKPTAIPVFFIFLSLADPVFKVRFFSVLKRSQLHIDFLRKLLLRVEHYVEIKHLIMQLSFLRKPLLMQLSRLRVM